MQHTTIEQSKRLVELGLDPRSADMFWDTLGECHVDNHHIIAEVTKDNGFDLQRDVYPAWSLDALLKVFPFPYQISRSRDGSIRFMLLNFKRQDTFDTELEAVYTMVVQLLEDDLIND